MLFTFGLIIGLLIGHCWGAYSFYRWAVKRGWMERSDAAPDPEFDQELDEGTYR